MSSRMLTPAAFDAWARKVESDRPENIMEAGHHWALACLGIGRLFAEESEPAGAAGLLAALRAVAMASGPGRLRAAALWVLRQSALHEIAEVEIRAEARAVLQARAEADSLRASLHASWKTEQALRAALDKERGTKPPWKDEQR